MAGVELVGKYDGNNAGGKAPVGKDAKGFEPAMHLFNNKDDVVAEEAVADVAVVKAEPLVVDFASSDDLPLSEDETLPF